MKDQLNQILNEALSFQLETKEHLEDFRLKFLSKKSSLQNLLESFKKLDKNEKRELGKPLNVTKRKIEDIFESKKHLYDSSTLESKEDITLPTKAFELGTQHPISIVQDEIITIFQKLGFAIAEGPEIEDDWHNFSALNFPPEHPARDMQDTFFIDKEHSLRTHTSSVQVRVMENNKPPIRIIAPGRVYRNEAVSARSNSFFHQLEGLVIDKDTTFADMKQTLYHFVKALFGEREIRFRASYFPFTEPSAEMDIYLGLTTESDRKLTKGTGWLEVLGCGMIDPNVLESCGLDPERYSGYAFGLGIDRLTMLRYGIKDIRDMFDNDVRFLRQFKGE
ncbi:phenylalanine--tRNA ligase subunit alpha [Bacteroidia bacterium]|jgi:phenylalanyl-tRNA synthetase alpha chain|nr:phenylalanine--tRNA ligase subunit alpha [Bacteroidia bacterium]